MANKKSALALLLDMSGTMKDYNNTIKLYEKYNKITKTDAGALKKKEKIKVKHKKLIIFFSLIRLLKYKINLLRWTIIL